MSAWISVKEKLPEGSKLFHFQRVLLKSGEVLTARRTWDEWVGENEICVQYVTHWMPLKQSNPTEQTSKSEAIDERK